MILKVNKRGKDKQISYGYVCGTTWVRIIFTVGVYLLCEWTLCCR